MEEEHRRARAAGEDEAAAADNDDDDDDDDAAADADAIAHRSASEVTHDTQDTRYLHNLGHLMHKNRS
jgi:hypothetical protein